MVNGIFSSVDRFDAGGIVFPESYHPMGNVNRTIRSVLLTSPKCGKHLLLSDNLEKSKYLKCPSCKTTFKNPKLFKPKKGKINPVVWVVIVIGLLIVMVYPFGEVEESTTSSQSNNATGLEWYEGGTLHDSSISEWRNATERNKLATCADWIAKIDNTISMEELYIRANSLVICIDEATKGLDVMDDEPAAGIAVLCIKTLEYDQ